MRARAADAFQSAFRVAPVVARQVRADGLGIFGWQTPEFEGFELAQHDELVVALHSGGSRRVRQVTDGGLSPARSIPGLITLLPPGQAARFRTHGSVGVVTLHVPTGGGAAQSLIDLATAAPSCFAMRDPYVSAAMETLVRAARADGTLPADYLPRIADALLCHLEHWAASVEGCDAAVRDPLADAQWVGRLRLCHLLDYVDAHLRRKLTLDELAGICGLKRAQFCAAFQVASGSTPHQHLVQRRVHAARRLLLHTAHDLAFIAQECGFSSQSHFTEQFRRCTGQTPARYRGRH
ncbi:helix-turn-helix transcriptional regulator [Panacagrimonas sp.]|uniref:helix-turn-helix transcriptional regulator n=1 Tax=Panacagrimonas sp. TaxID=2480088 RepID=UPI003B528E37